MIGAGARVNKIGKDFIPKWLRPYSTLVAILMVAVWISTHDVEKIQRVVACGNFVCKHPPSQTTHSLPSNRGQTFFQGGCPARLLS